MTDRKPGNAIKELLHNSPTKRRPSEREEQKKRVNPFAQTLGDLIDWRRDKQEPTKPEPPRVPFTVSEIEAALQLPREELSEWCAQNAYRMTREQEKVFLEALAEMRKQERLAVQDEERRAIAKVVEWSRSLGKTKKAL